MVQQLQGMRGFKGMLCVRSAVLTSIGKCTTRMHHAHQSSFYKHVQNILQAMPFQVRNSR
jgi:hypothetical protein